MTCLVSRLKNICGYEKQAHTSIPIERDRVNKISIRARSDYEHCGKQKPTNNHGNGQQST